MMTQNGNSSSNRSYLSIGSNLKICHINIEGISISKSEYLARLMHAEDIDIVTVQETHAGSEENLRRIGTIPGYSFIGLQLRTGHRNIRQSIFLQLPYCRVPYQDHSYDVHSLPVEVDGTIVVNVIQLFMLTISIHITNFGVKNTTMLTKIDSWSG
jgi:hypothetical protein